MLRGILSPCSRRHLIRRRTVRARSAWSHPRASAVCLTAQAPRTTASARPPFSTSKTSPPTPRESIPHWTRSSWKWTRFETRWMRTAELWKTTIVTKRKGTIGAWMCLATAASTTELRPEIQDPTPVSTKLFHQSCWFIKPINVIFIKTYACNELRSWFWLV